MKNSEQSTNGQQTGELRAFKDLVAMATLFLVVVAAIALLFIAIEQNTKDSEARCKSLGGVTGQTKCFKNGTEIYEGDVVIYGELTYSVEYGLSRFMLCAPRKLSICLSKLTYHCDTNQLNCEVIGNIHENPELVEEK